MCVLDEWFDATLRVGRKQRKTGARRTKAGPEAKAGTPCADSPPLGALECSDVIAECSNGKACSNAASLYAYQQHTLHIDFSTSLALNSASFIFHSFPRSLAWFSSAFASSFLPSMSLSMPRLYRATVMTGLQLLTS